MTRLSELILISKFSSALDHTPNFYLLDPQFMSRMSGAMSDFAEKHGISLVESRLVLKGALKAQLARRLAIKQLERAA